MKRIFIISLALLALLPPWLAASCSPGAYSGPVTSVIIGTTSNEVNSLILVAQDRGYFADNGIEITHKIYTSGVAAIDGIFNGEVNMATGSEFAFAGDVLDGEHIRTIAVIDRSSVNYLVARLDRGIKSIADLKGKKIGVPMGSRPEFALNRFLVLRGIEPSEVTLVNVPVNKSPDALVNGEVDAVATWQPYINQIKERMGDVLLVLPTQEGQPSYTLIMCNADWVAGNPETIRRFLKSLVQSESYINDFPQEAKAFIRDKMNYDEVYMESIWPENIFSLSLEQSLLLAIEDQTRWMISNNMTAEKTVPNFLDYIYTDGLKAVKPGAVGITGK
jgi:NitT/TauT family transport system substrate-binding protein